MLWLLTAAVAALGLAHLWSLRDADGLVVGPIQIVWILAVLVVGGFATIGLDP